MHISKVQEELGHYEYKSDEKLPTLINSNNKIGIISVKDIHGNVI
jgi:hypothetical protein